jgi:hypothetical protein
METVVRGETLAGYDSIAGAKLKGEMKRKRSDLILYKGMKRDN